MSSRDYQILVAGGGIDGMAAALLLARGGRRVVLCEARDELGGTARPREFHPGYRTDGLLGSERSLAPALVEALDGSSAFAGHHNAQGALLLHGTEGRWGEAPADFAADRLDPRASSDSDRAAWSDLQEFAEALRAPLMGLMGGALPHPKAASLFELLGTGAGLRRLGRRRLIEFMRVTPMPAADWLGDAFEDAALATALARSIPAALPMGPRAPGTAILVLLEMVCARTPRRMESRALLAELERALRASGVEVRTGCPIESWSTDDKGAVRGARLTGGAELRAEQVLSTLEPKRTLGALLPVRSRGSATRSLARCWRTRGGTQFLHLALEGTLRFPEAPHPTAGRALLGAVLEDIELAQNALKYRDEPESPWLDVRIPSRADPSSAPKGCDSVVVAIHGVPASTAGHPGSRERLVERVLARLEAAAPGTRSRILGMEHLTQVDLEAEYGLTGGHLHHGELGLDQLLMRPSLGMLNGATPVPGLTLGGRGTHPGPFLVGGAGILGARRILAAGS